MYGKKVSFNFINNVHKIILGKLKPNLTFVLKVKPKVSKKKLKKESLKIDMTIFLNHFTIRHKNLFLKISKNKKNYFVFDSSLNDSSLENEILKITLKEIKIV